MGMQDAIEAIKGTRVLVIGDVMLDRFVYGDVRRQSPEAPVPVLLHDHETMMPGGGANAALNLCGLGVQTTLIGVVGNDAYGVALDKALREAGMHTEHLMIDTTRPTIIKTRYVSQDGQIVRVDHEKTHPVSDDIAHQIIAAAAQGIEEGARAVILSDYAKGVLRSDIIRTVIDLSNDKNIPVIVDPKGDDYTRYQGAYAITPNRKELHEATGMSVESDDDVVAAAHALQAKAGLQHIVAKRSEDGITLVPADAHPVHIKVTAKDVRDVSGAGDTVVATLSAALAAGLSLVQAARLANDAAGIAVGRPGTCVIAAEDFGETPQNFISPIIGEWDDAAKTVRLWQSQGLKVGFTNGCFDILHYGHVNYIAQARARCDKLIVGLNHDRSVKILKGEERPVNDQLARANVMAALGAVNMVVFFGAQEKDQDNTPSALLDVLRPDILFKGGDYTVDQLPEAKVVQAYGGSVDIMPLYDGYSTTATIKKMKNDKEKAA